MTFWTYDLRNGKLALPLVSVVQHEPEILHCKVVSGSHDSQNWVAYKERQNT